MSIPEDEIGDNSRDMYEPGDPRAVCWGCGGHAERYSWIRTRDRAPVLVGLCENCAIRVCGELEFTIDIALMVIERGA